MIKFKGIKSGTVRRCVEHQDAYTERHRKDMVYQGSGAEPDGWLAGLRATVTDYGPDWKEPPSTEELLAEIRARAKRGRRPKRPAHELGYQWIFNPGDEVQSQLRALSKIAPDLFVSAHQFLDSKVDLAITRLCPGSIGRRAFHPDSGRWHKEGTICKYGPDGRTLDWARGLRYDTAERTVACETRLAGNEPISHLRINSMMAVELRRAFIFFIRTVIEKELRKRNLVAEYEASCRDSLRVLVAQAIRREMGFTLKFPNPRAQKMTRARERIDKWTEKFIRLFPEEQPPTFKDFSLLGLLFRAIDESQLSSVKKTAWKADYQEHTVSYFRDYLAYARPPFDKKNAEMDAVIAELAWSPLRQFVEVDKLLRGQFLSQIDAGCLLAGGMNKSSMRLTLRTVLKAADLRQFFPQLLHAYDHRKSLSGPRR